MYEFPQNPTITNPKIQCLSGNSHWMAGFFFGGSMRVCNVEGCNKKYFARGYCKKHYSRYRRNGNPNIVLREYHGYVETSEYHIWASMKNRCYNNTQQNYKYYGGRGITVCDRWRKSFVAFLEDMGMKLFPETEIDRIDNNGNYEPKNCRWTTHTINVRNSPRIKLTIEKAQEIRRLYKTGIYSHRSLGIEYGVHHSVIGDIIRKELWVK